jgi:hypothetical protein
MIRVAVRSAVTVFISPGIRITLATITTGEHAALPRFPALARIFT